MSEEKAAPIQFGEDEEQPVSTDINPQEIEDNPAEYARKVAAQKASEYDQMAGFSVPRDYECFLQREEFTPLIRLYII